VSKFHSIWSTIAQESNLERNGRILRENHVFQRPRTGQCPTWPGQGSALSFELHKPLVGQCSALPDNVRLRFSTRRCSRFWPYLANRVYNWSHSFSAAFITSRGSFIRCWLVCSSYYYSVLALGIELRIGRRAAARAPAARAPLPPLICSWAASPWIAGPVIGLGWKPAQVNNQLSLFWMNLIEIKFKSF
jgi:hypothetical protein